jgi:hypothetical protein
MESLTRPKRALLAYCALADRLHQSSPNLLQALTPFFAPVCADLAGEFLDAGKFSNEVFERYGLRIPRLAVLGLAEQLASDGLLIPVAGKASQPVYQYAPASSTPSDGGTPVSEVEIDKVLAEFTARCLEDPLLAATKVADLEEAFLDRLLQTDSMRLLARREATSATKRSASTLTLKSVTPTEEDHIGLRLDFHVAQYLVDLRESQPATFDRVSDIAFANMAAEALACFSEPGVAAKDLSGLTLYLDSPLLLDILGVNTEYSEYGAELLQMISQSGATAAVFDDCIAEAESVVAAQHASLRSGIAQRSSYWGTSAKPHTLNALINNVAERAVGKGIAVHRDPDVSLIARSTGAVGDIQAQMNKRMQGWPNDEARKHDERSVWSMLRVRDSTSACRRVGESKSVFVARNTALVRIANDAWRHWLSSSSRHSQHIVDSWAPVAMSDKQLAGYLWLRKGAGNGQMSKARLLAHCSAAIRPRADVKAKAYNLVLELHGKQDAEHIAALLEDREGERTLMRVTRADPEDVTKERLPFILEQVKLAAGEYAASAVRDQAREELDATRAAHQIELDQIQAVAAADRQRSEARADAAAAALVQEKLDREQLQGRLDQVAGQLSAAEQSRKRREAELISQAFVESLAAHRRMRWELVALFAAVSLWATTSATDWAPMIQLSSTFLLTCVGFWFVPEYLEGVVRRHSLWVLHTSAARVGARGLLPSTPPDFKAGVWRELEALRLA